MCWILLSTEFLLLSFASVEQSQVVSPFLSLDCAQYVLKFFLYVWAGKKRQCVSSKECHISFPVDQSVFPWVYLKKTPTHLTFYSLMFFSQRNISLVKSISISFQTIEINKIRKAVRCHCLLKPYEYWKKKNLI